MSNIIILSMCHTSSTSEEFKNTQLLNMDGNIE